MRAKPHTSWLVAPLLSAAVAAACTLLACGEARTTIDLPDAGQGGGDGEGGGDAAPAACAFRARRSRISNASPGPATDNAPRPNTPSGSSSTKASRTRAPAHPARAGRLRAARAPPSSLSTKTKLALRPSAAWGRARSKTPARTSFRPASPSAASPPQRPSIIPARARPPAGSSEASSRRRTP
jgi:hypothetical protein